MLEGRPKVRDLGKCHLGSGEKRDWWGLGRPWDGGVVGTW